MADDSAQGAAAPARAGPRPALLRAARFGLLADTAAAARIDAGLRGGADIGGSTAWILMLAIFIASIGLNTNSTAVIIGAMLVSPLMGPIMGVGYGIGIYDFELVRRSLGNLGVAVAISLATSTLYFALTPLTGEQSELLARTSPTIWDVQIALFGGLAGIIGATRKQKSNVIPGVAIATALMPPLCTAGFGLAQGNWQYFLGAFYLFTINSVFIAVAATVVVRMLGLPPKVYVDHALERRIRAGLLAVTLLTALPSVYLAWKLVQDEIFGARARAFVAREFRLPGVHVLEQTTSPGSRRLTVTLMGEVVARTTLQDIRARLSESGLPGATLDVFQTREAEAAAAARQDGAGRAALAGARKALEDSARTIEELRGRQAPWLEAGADMAAELRAQWPQLTDVVIGSGAEAGAGGDAAVALLSARSPRPLPAAELRRMRAWFAARAKTEVVRVMVETSGPAAKGARP